MDRLTFVPGGGEFFLWFDDDSGGAPCSLAARLTRVGWPSAARLVGGPASGHHISGTLIEMIDALPALAGQPPDESAALPPSLSLYVELARRGLTLVAEGRLAPRLHPRLGGPDPRPSAWAAGWQALPGPLAEDDPLLRLAREAGPEVAVVLGRLVSVRQLHLHETRRLVSGALDGCADVLVREACWRGAVVRLAGWPADAWEQRLVHALCDQHPYFATGEAEQDDPAILGAELVEWTRMLAEGAALLPSPPSWRAPESLQAVLARITEPAERLARRLLLDEPAPRSLPTSGRDTLPLSRG